MSARCCSSTRDPIVKQDNGRNAYSDSPTQSFIGCEDMGFQSYIQDRINNLEYRIQNGKTMDLSYKSCLSGSEWEAVMWRKLEERRPEPSLFVTGHGPDPASHLKALRNPRDHNLSSDFRSPGLHNASDVYTRLVQRRKGYAMASKLPQSIVEDSSRRKSLLIHHKFKSVENLSNFLKELDRGERESFCYNLYKEVFQAAVEDAMIEKGWTTKHEKEICQFSGIQQSCPMNGIASTTVAPPSPPGSPSIAGAVIRPEMSALTTAAKQFGAAFPPSPPPEPEPSYPKRKVEDDIYDGANKHRRCSDFAEELTASLSNTAGEDCDISHVESDSNADSEMCDTIEERIKKSEDKTSIPSSIVASQGVVGSIRFTAFPNTKKPRGFCDFPPITRVLKTGHEVFAIGRSSEQSRPEDVLFESRSINEQHCNVWNRDGNWYIRDTGSSHGTFLNFCRLSRKGQWSEAAQLRHGDWLQLGTPNTLTSAEEETRAVRMQISLFPKRSTPSISEEIFSSPKFTAPIEEKIECFKRDLMEAISKVKEGQRTLIRELDCAGPRYERRLRWGKAERFRTDHLVSITSLHLQMVFSGLERSQSQPNVFIRTTDNGGRGAKEVTFDISKGPMRSFLKEHQQTLGMLFDVMWNRGPKRWEDLQRMREDLSRIRTLVKTPELWKERARYRKEAKGERYLPYPVAALFRKEGERIEKEVGMQGAGRLCLFIRDSLQQVRNYLWGKQRWR